MWFLQKNCEKQINCVLIVTCYKVKKCHILGNDLFSVKKNIILAEIPPK